MISIKGIGLQNVTSRASKLQSKNLQKILKFKSNKRKLIKYPLHLDPIIDKETLSIDLVPERKEESFEKKLKVGLFFIKPRLSKKNTQKSNIHLQVISKQFSFNQIEKNSQKKLQRFKTIAETHPRLHKIKNDYLQNQVGFNQRHLNIHQSLRQNKQKKKLLRCNLYPFKLQENLNCRKMTAFDMNSKPEQAGSRRQFEQKNTDSSSKYRYNQLSPQEFYYERRGRQIQKFLADRVSKYMSKHVKTISNLPDYEYAKNQL